MIGFIAKNVMYFRVEINCCSGLASNDPNDGTVKRERKNESCRNEIAGVDAKWRNYIG